MAGASACLHWGGPDPQRPLLLQGLEREAEPGEGDRAGPAIRGWVLLSYFQSRAGLLVDYNV